MRIDFQQTADFAMANIEPVVESLTGARLVRGRMCCPLHGGDNPSMLSVRNGKGWHCFKGCGSGDGIEFVRRYLFSSAAPRVGRTEAIRYVADRFGLTSRIVGRLEIGRPVGRARLPPSIVKPSGDGGRAPPPLGLIRALYAQMNLGPRGTAYCAERGLDLALADRVGIRSIETQSDWEVLRETAAGFPTEARSAIGLKRMPLCVPTTMNGVTRWSDAGPVLVLPYEEPGGSLIGLRMRAIASGALGTINGRPLRYRSLKDVPISWPFMAGGLAESAGRALHIAEGEFNALSLRQCGVHAIGLPGASLWQQHWTPMLEAVNTLYLWFDNDEAGRRGRAKLIRELRKAFGLEWLRQRCWYPTLDPGVDLNDALRLGALSQLIEQVQRK